MENIRSKEQSRITVDTKYSPAVKPSSKRAGRVTKWRIWNNLYFNVGITIVAGFLALIIMYRMENVADSAGITDILQHMIFTKGEFAWPPQQWNYSSFRFEPNVSDWDQQRATWMKAHGELSSEEGARPRVMMVTESATEPCEPSIWSHLFLRSAKNKLDYSRIHDIELYYNMGKPYPDFSDLWVKLPVIRMLMLQHPELEWIWWLDADAIFTDMSFEPPFSELGHYNLVLYGEDQLVYRRRDWTSLSTSNFMIRNCQWSLDLLDAWASMGTATMREESGKFQTAVLANRPLDLPGDDQSSIIALLAQDHRNPLAEQKWAPSVKLVKETEYAMNGNWTIIGPELELFVMDKSRRIPFVSHFEGCLFACTGKPDPLSSERLDVCNEQLDRTFDFADNQVYDHYGFQPRTLGRSLESLVKIPTEDTKDAKKDDDYSLPPKLTDWDEQRQLWMDEHPSTKREEALIVSGSAPKPCESEGGGHLLLRALKNRIDYGRINGVKVFYNMAVIDKDLNGWWCKLPLIKMLMLDNPNVEWIWWLDSDAAFTDMSFKPPFSRYDESGYNLAMYGAEDLVFGEKKYTGINTGNVLFRNCQWTLDLLDRWASYGATEEIRVKNSDLLNNLLSDRGGSWSADDQSVLVYVLITEQEKWKSRTCFETRYAMSGEWMYWTSLFVDGAVLDIDPFVTHFAGCHPCKVDAMKECLVGMDKTYNFADNQVLESYGLRHENLNSSQLQKISTFMSNFQVDSDTSNQKEKLVETEDTATEQKHDEAKEESETSNTEDEDTSTEQTHNEAKEESKASNTEDEGTSTEQRHDEAKEESETSNTEDEGTSTEQKHNEAKEESETSNTEDEGTSTEQRHDEAKEESETSNTEDEGTSTEQKHNEAKEESETSNTEDEGTSTEQKHNEAKEESETSNTEDEDTSTEQKHNEAKEESETSNTEDEDTSTEQKHNEAKEESETSNTAEELNS